MVDSRTGDATRAKRRVPCDLAPDRARCSDDRGSSQLGPFHGNTNANEAKLENSGYTTQNQSSRVGCLSTVDASY